MALGIRPGSCRVEGRVEMIIAAAHIGRLGGKLLVAPDWSYFPSTKGVLIY